MSFRRVSPVRSTFTRSQVPTHRWLAAFVCLCLAAWLVVPCAAEERETPVAENATATTETPDQPTESTDEDLPSEEKEALEAAVARPVPADPVQVFGWREKLKLEDIDHEFHAKLDTGALTSSIHAEDVKLFERDGAKWVRFIATDPRDESSKRVPVEAPLVRYARIKNIGGGDSDRREVVRLRITLGKRSLRGEFTLANRSNMLVPVLIGRSMIKDLGWIDSSRTYLAEQEVFR